MRSVRRFRSTQRACTVREERKGHSPLEDDSSSASVRVSRGSGGGGGRGGRGSRGGEAVEWRRSEVGWTVVGGVEDGVDSVGGIGTDPKVGVCQSEVLPEGVD